MRAFLRWLLGVPDVVDVDLMRRLSHDVEECRDDVEHLGRRFTKLQGQVTRAWRDELPAEEEDEEDSDKEFERLMRERRSHVG